MANSLSFLGGGGGTDASAQDGSGGESGRSRAEWREDIFDELGGEGVDIELTERNCDRALDFAVDLWNRYRPFTKWFPFEVPAAETIRIEFFADPERTDEFRFPEQYIRNVLDVQFQDRDRRVLGPRAGFLEGYYLRWGYQGPRLFFQLHVAQRNYERLTGSRPDWYWDPAARSLWISTPSRDVNAMVLVTRERKLEEIPYDQHSLFRKAAVARAKYYLARILGSRGPIPVAAPNPMETDASELRQESKEEWEAVEQQLQVSLASIPPPRWVG